MKKYIREIVPEDLSWYERDSLVTYIGQLKYKDFISNSDAYLEKAEVINFDMIYARFSRRPQQYSEQHYQTVRLTNVSKRSKKEKKKAVSACFHSERQDTLWKKNWDIFVEEKLSLSHLLEK